MKTTLWILSSLAAGVAFGMLLAPQKGSTLRKKILRAQEEWMDTLKSSYAQAMNSFWRAKDETSDVSAEGGEQGKHTGTRGQA